MIEENQWRRCNACKKPIEFGASYWVCNVSTCNRKRTGLAFCTVSCWEVHLPVAKHRESWAEERTAPTRAQAEAEARGEKPARTLTIPGNRSTSCSERFTASLTLAPVLYISYSRAVSRHAAYS